MKKTFITMAIALTLCVPFLSSCAAMRPASVDEVLDYSQYTKLGRYNNVEFLAEKTFKTEELERLFTNAKIITREFERDWSRRVEPIQVYIVDAAVVPCGIREGSFNGCFYGPSGPITVIGGPRENLPSLYHEFVHWTLPDHDYEHTRPEWSRAWNIRQGAIQNMLD